MSILDSISRIAVITFEHEDEQYHTNIRDLGFYKNVILQHQFFEVNSMNLAKYDLNPDLFIVDDPTFINKEHLPYIRSNNFIYTQSNKTIVNKLIANS